MKRTLVWFIVILVFASGTTLFAQTVYYVQSLKARVLSGKSFRYPVIAEAAKGSRLVSTGKAGSWIMVKIGKQVGYVPLLLVSTHPPLDKVGLIKAEDADIKQGVRRRASSYTSAAAARGLTMDDRRRLSKEEKVDYDGLEKMESFSVSAEEISRFKEGGVL